MRMFNIRPKSRMQTGIANSAKSKKGSIGPSMDAADEMMKKSPMKKKKKRLFGKMKKSSMKMTKVSDDQDDNEEMY